MATIVVVSTLYFGIRLDHSTRAFRVFLLPQFSVQGMYRLVHLKAGGTLVELWAWGGTGLTFNIFSMVFELEIWDAR